LYFKEIEVKEVTPVVSAIGEMNFVGHIIPHTWYDHIRITTPTGRSKPHMNAVVILSDIVYWYRPRIVMDEQTGRVVSKERRFHADKLQRSYAQISRQFGITKRAASEACHFLEDMGLITMEFRTIRAGELVMNNVLFLEPVPKALEKLQEPKKPPEIEDDDDYELLTDPLSPFLGGGSSEKQGEGLAKNRETNTKITTKTTTSSYPRNSARGATVTPTQPAVMGKTQERVELEYVDIDQENDANRKQKWQTPETQEQKDLLAVTNKKWFGPTEKTKAKGLLNAIRIGDALGEDVYYQCEKALKDMPVMEGRRLPPIPRTWLTFRAEQAKVNRWSFNGFLNALYNRDELVKHCQYYLRTRGQRQESREWIDI
jgi:hypothetical protein